MVTLGLFTVTSQLTDVLSAVAVIVVVPGFLAVITPASLMTATLVLLDFHFTGCPVDTSAARLVVYPFSNDTEVFDSVMIVGSTIILQLASPFLILAVITASPAFFAVILPYVFTDATVESLDEKEGFFHVEVT